MRDRKEVLWRLGACDIATQGLSQRLAELPGLIADAEAKAREARDFIEQQRRTLGEAERQRRSGEAELQDCEAQRDRFQSQTALVKTNHEYTALLHEIDGMNERISAIEEEILAAMETAEQISAGLDAVVEEQTGIEQAHLRQAERLRAEIGEAKQGLERKEKEREELLALLGPDVKQRYERVRAVTGTGTARIEGQSCVACHRQIPPETVNRALAGEVHTCGCCQRLLVIGEQ